MKRQFINVYGSKMIPKMENLAKNQKKTMRQSLENFKPKLGAQAPKTSAQAPDGRSSASYGRSSAEVIGQFPKFGAQALIRALKRPAP